MIHQIKRKINNNTIIPLCVIEFTYDNDNIIIASDEDCHISLNESLEFLNNDNYSNYPLIKIIYNNTMYGMQIISAKYFQDNHIYDKTRFNQDKVNVNEKHMFSNTNKRLYIIGFKIGKNGEVFNEVNFTKECKYACISYIYYSINDIEAFYNSTINLNELIYRTNTGYNRLPQKQRENIAKLVLMS